MPYKTFKASIRASYPVSNTRPHEDGRTIVFIIDDEASATRVIEFELDALQFISIMAGAGTGQFSYGSVDVSILDNLDRLGKKQMSASVSPAEFIDVLDKKNYSSEPTEAMIDFAKAYCEDYGWATYTWRRTNKAHRWELIVFKYVDPESADA